MLGFPANFDKKFLWIAALLVAVIGVATFKSSWFCGGNIFCVEKHSQWLKHRLDRNIPIFMSMDQNDNSEIATSLRKHLADFTSKQAEQKSHGPISCAVIGNGITLLESGYGQQIDQHDYVFRINTPPIAGFEKDVGSKTTFNGGINNHNYKQGNYGSDSYAVILGGVNTLEPLDVQQARSKKNVMDKTAILDLLGPERVLVISDEFNNYIESKWFVPKTNSSTYVEASSGFRSIILAIHLCSKVDLYGFGPDEKGRHWHYFYQGGLATGHLPDYQEQFIHELQDHNVVTFYPGNPLPSTVPPPHRQ